MQIFGVRLWDFLINFLKAKILDKLMLFQEGSKNRMVATTIELMLVAIEHQLKKRRIKSDKKNAHRRCHLTIE